MSAIDPAALDRLRAELGADDATMRELVETFLAEAPRQVAELRAAAGAGDAQRVGRLAHSLKSSAATFGAARLRELCAETEATARASPREATARVPAIADEWARVEADLRARFG